MDPSGAVKSPDDDLPAGLIEVSVSQPEELADDEICIAIKEDEVPDTVLKAVLWGLAEEQSSLKVLRQNRQGEGKDTSYISLKRGTLLKYMSETLLQRQALMGASTDLDLRGPKFREIFKMLLGIISDTFEEIKVPEEYKDMFFHALSKNLEGWEIRAEKIIKAMTPKVR
jgi:hypothetical protein